MTEKITWMVFNAHPTGFIEEEDFHPDYFGTFVCPESRREPQQLLIEVLGNQKLSLIQINNTQRKSLADDWGMNERLKHQLNEQGFGLTLVKLHGPPSQL